ncbi:2225_t:CDS:1, partial [Acaulospora colombiana]
EHLSSPNKHNSSSNRAANGDKAGSRRNVKSLKGWHSHSVALVHAIVIIPLAFQILNLPALDGPRERAFGWDDRAGFVHAIASG